MRPMHNQRLLWLALALLMCATRFDHFGSSLRLPDASYAVFFFTGLSALGVPALVGLALGAAAIDAVSLAGGVDAACFSPAYPFVFVGYAVLFLLGRAARGQGGLRMLALVTCGALAAFAISNAGFYAFSGQFASLSLLEYATRVAPFAGRYVGNALFYLAPAAAVIAVRRTRTSRASHFGAE